jgi:hypothetical protein
MVDLGCRSTWSSSSPRGLHFPENSTVDWFGKGVINNYRDDEAALTEDFNSSCSGRGCKEKILPFRRLAL